MTPIETPTDSACAPLREALRAAASALKGHGPRFALAGSYALLVLADRLGLTG